MNIDFELYRIFYTVANNKNITKAAEELNISQPAISKSIKTLDPQKISYELLNYARNENLVTKDDMSIIALKIKSAM